MFDVNKWRIGQAVKTWPSQGRNMGSIPVCVTKKKNPVARRDIFIFIIHNKTVFYRKAVKTV